MKINVASKQYSLDTESYEIYVSGCNPPHCHNCHNPELWDFGHGKIIDDDFYSELKADIIEKDLKNSELYKNFGYKVVRIPYFIQLTNKAVKTLFDVEVLENLFDESISSLGIKGRNTPAYLCIAGITRMAVEFKKFPEQYKTNIDSLKKQNDSFKSGVEYLENEYKNVITRQKESDDRKK